MESINDVYFTLGLSISSRANILLKMALRALYWIIVAMLGWAFCSSAFAFFGRTESWTEDVALHDGRQVIVEREVDWTYRSATLEHRSGFHWPDKFWLKFKHPDTQETIRWQGERDFHPVLLDFVSGVPYLVVYGTSTKDTEHLYGCPDLPYIYLQYDQNKWGGWKAIPVESAPDALRRANLSPKYPDIGKKHLSAEDVQRLMHGPEGSSEGYFQKDIPRTYKEWRYAYKNSHLNERRRGDCRPPRTPLPPVVLPASLERTPELIETINYEPARVSSGDDWARLTFDQKRADECKKLFRPTDPNDYMQDQRFVGDPTGSKPVPYSRNGQFQMGVRVLCDEYVWFVTHIEERGKMIITKYTHAGDFASRISFPHPQPIQGFVGHIASPSIRSDAGYIYFDWMNSREIIGTNFREINREWHIKRILKLRVEEPSLQNTETRR